jgi:hypothetical protein
VRVTTAQPTADPTAELPEPAPGAGQAAQPARWRPTLRLPWGPTSLANRLANWRAWLPDLAVCLGFVALAFWLAGGLFPDPATRALRNNASDQALEEWFLAVATRLFTGDLRLVTHLLNSPDGVNLMSNASSLLLGVLLAPITVLFGAPVSFAVATVGNVAGTAIAWYLLLARTLRYRRLAAILGGAFAGFAPGMMSQLNSHLHMSSAWLVPGIVWCLLRLADPAIATMERRQRRRRVVGTAALFAVLIVVQVFLGEEVLFLSALTLLLFCVAYAAQAPRAAWRVLPVFATGIGLAAAMSAVVLAYPLWIQFAGPQSVPNGTFSPNFYMADLASFVAISPMSLAGDPENVRLASGPTELNTFLGVPLLVVVAFLTLWLWRRPAAVAATVAACAMGALALGPEIVVNGERTGISGPYKLLHALPVIDGALPTRFALAMIPLIAVVIAMALDRAMREPSRLRLLVPLALVVALVPIAPRQLPTEERRAVPRFITEGYWRTCVKPGGVLVPVPPPEPDEPDTMRWAAAANAEFSLPEGFFIGPYGSKGNASLGVYPRQLSHYLRHTSRTGGRPFVDDELRAVIHNDLAYWKAECVVLAHGTFYDQLRISLDEMLGPGEDVADVRIWRLAG